ncbi:UNVERIFIED_CONTAM: cytochrome b5 family heme/steroid binding domain-containing protein [Hammondia hammondi]|eukprot:XP_008888724.1 cytochrome b5 family heme/steroid binding domain-containing protein [Hammondia hammondi]
MLLTMMKQWVEKLDFWTIAGIVLGSLATYKMVKASLRCHSFWGNPASDGTRQATSSADRAYKAPPKPNPCPRDFTLDELRGFNGNQKPLVAKATEAPAAEASSGVRTPEAMDAASASAVAAAAVGALPPIYLALKGRVYDVTSHRDGRRFYAADGPYGIFAGSDVTMNLAKMVFSEGEKNTVPSKWQTLSPAEKETVEDWEERFKAKYDHVGFVVFGVPAEDALLREMYSEERKEAGLSV